MNSNLIMRRILDALCAVNEDGSNPQSPSHLAMTLNIPRDEFDSAVEELVQKGYLERFIKGTDGTSILPVQAISCVDLFQKSPRDAYWNTLTVMLHYDNDTARLCSVDNLFVFHRSPRSVLCDLSHAAKKGEPFLFIFGAAYE